MSDAYVGEIRLFAGDFAPPSWALCHGQVLSISEYETLFVLIGTTYGGDGEQTFSLPDLRGRAPMHMGTGPNLSPRTIGETGGAELVGLSVQQLPNHSHQLVVESGSGATANPDGNLLAGGASSALYQDVGLPDASLASSTVLPVGSSHLHENRMPFTAVNYIICLNGIFPQHP